jgi:hypothetical protein
MTEIGVSLAALESRFLEISEGRVADDIGNHGADYVLAVLGYVDETGRLTDAGHAYYLAHHVRRDAEASTERLALILRNNPIVTAFCGTLWGVGDVPVAGAVSLLKRLTGSGDDHSAKRWLELMGRARLITYNRKNPLFRVLFNPAELVSPDEDAAQERNKGHVLSPETPYGNLLALRDLLRAARKYLYWYEQHMSSKTLEVLHRELAKGSVARVRLLSGPANIDAEAKADFKRFAREMQSRRGIECEWRVLSRKDAQRLHDRFLFSEGIIRNLPPLNLILQGSVGEILPSEVTAEDFDTWWETGQDLQTFNPPEAS